MSIEKKEDWQTFQDRISILPEKDRQLIDRAYQMAKAGHGKQTRIQGGRYFEHPRHTALILWDECGIRNPKLIIAALLHDTCEDTPIFGNPTKYQYSDWVKIARQNITVIFDGEIADMVIALTKPYVDKIEIVDRKQSKKIYLENINAASDETILVKMADRLHNLREMSELTKKTQIAKVRETEQDYFPIFTRVLKKYPKEGTYLLNEVAKAIDNLGLK